LITANHRTNSLILKENVVGCCFGWNGFYLYEVREVIIYN